MSDNPSRFSANGNGRGQGTPQPLPDAERQRRATSALNPVLEQINSKFTELEKSLKAKGFKPVDNVYVRYMADDAEQVEDLPTYYYVGLDLYKGEWRLCHGCGCEELQEFHPEGPVVESSRFTRVQIAQRIGDWLPRLKAAIADRTEDFGPEANDALRLLTEAIERV